MTEASFMSWGDSDAESIIDPLMFAEFKDEIKKAKDRDNIQRMKFEVIDYLPAITEEL